MILLALFWFVFLSSSPLGSSAASTSTSFSDESVDVAERMATTARARARARAATARRSAAAVGGGGDVTLGAETSRSFSSSSSDASAAPPTNKGPVPGLLRPCDLPGPVVFNSFHTNATMVLPKKKTAITPTPTTATTITSPFTNENNTNGSNSNNPVEQEEEPNEDVIRYMDGSVLQVNNFKSTVQAEVTMVPSIVPRDVVEQMVSLLRAYGGGTGSNRDSEEEDHLDQDPDTVDGMPSYEIFVDSTDLREKQATIKERDVEPDERRVYVRKQLQHLTAPSLERLTQFVRSKYPTICNDESRSQRLCTPCYSLIRRYRSGERQSHAIHYDGHALVTAVISLSDYGSDYTGGLYVATGHGGPREFLPLNKGDAAIHRSTLLHGVQVYDRDHHDATNQQQQPQEEKSHYTSERWSWILWFRDSDTCQDYSHEWFADCAEKEQNPLCQQLHATKVLNADENRDSDLETQSRQIMRLNLAAAHGGAGEAAVKVARAYLKRLPSYLEYDVNQAKRYFQMAIESSYSPEGHYGMASILVEEAKAYAKDPYQQYQILQKAVYHLERAAHSFHPFACFNLGMAHVYGYGVPQVDMELGVEWFLQSGLPEGFFVASQYAASIGDTQRQDEWGRRAFILGFNRPWRQMARERTGSGGAGGVDLNLSWPPSIARGGMEPPKL